MRLVFTTHSWRSSESSSSSHARRRTQRWQGRRDASCAEAEGIMLTGSTQSISRQDETSQVLHTVLVGSHCWYYWRDVSCAQHRNRSTGRTVEHEKLTCYCCG